MNEAIAPTLLRQLVQADNGLAIPRLRKAGYMSPRGVPFRCSTCHWFNRGENYCANRDIRSTVELGGCCNYWTSPGGVHG